MSTTACKSCSFFETATSADAGLCRVNPPVFLTEAEKRGAWPVVKTDDWCGSHSTAH
jgi:hypothetical protein